LDELFSARPACWEQRPENYQALLHCACALIACRAAGFVGYGGRFATSWAKYSSA
jgi:hypothetical protein